ncbi:MAG: response regulator [Magnetococcales bacterium]|nr:response regulator [Magnetococcales bacterium]
MDIEPTLANGHGSRGCVRVLIIDDSPISILPLADFLSKSYNVFLMTSGIDALEFLKSTKVDIIILDVVMPDMDGYETCVKMKENQDLDHIPIIFITVRASPDDVVRGLQCGANYYLEKPYNKDIVLAVIKSAINRSLLRKRLLKNVKDTVGTFGLINEGCFSFRTLDEAHHLAVLLASACPDPGNQALGLKELFVNAVEHGNLGITYGEKTALLRRNLWRIEVKKRLDLPENKNKLSSVRLERKEDEIVFIITDQGSGFDWRPFEYLDAQRAFHTHGRGIAMAKALYFDEIVYRGCGNEVMAIVHLDKRG